MRVLWQSTENILQGKSSDPPPQETYRELICYECFFDSILNFTAWKDMRYLDFLTLTFNCQDIILLTQIEINSDCHFPTAISNPTLSPFPSSPETSNPVITTAESANPFHATTDFYDCNTTIWNSTEIISGNSKQTVIIATVTPITLILAFGLLIIIYLRIKRIKSNVSNPAPTAYELKQNLKFHICSCHPTCQLKYFI